ncbi:hypothetical protein [Streptomyces sp. NPDC086776]|uniref:hypothetical protein n=1 Tax=Streptomyces sp. NPDC086776 TaxID=3365756 RepID=UPI00380FB28A
MGKAKTERRKARALARPLELSRMDGAKGRPEITARVKAESMHGTNVPARVVERMSGSTKDVRVSAGDSGPKLRPKRKPRTMGSEAAAAGIVGRDYGSKGDGIKRKTADQIRCSRDAYFVRAEESRNARAAQIVGAPVPVGPDPVARAREDYAHALGKANERRAVGDASGAEAWMQKARQFRRIFRNK